MPAAIPLIIGAAGQIGSAYVGGKMGQSAANAYAKRSPEELALMKSQTGLADQQKQQGQEMFGQAMPAINQTLKYYQTLLGGNRAARTSAVAPEASDIASVYGGANKALKGRYITGGERSTALAENEREKAGRISRLVTGVRPGAASAQGALGGELAAGAGSMYRGSQDAYSGLFRNATQNRQMSNELGFGVGSQFSKQMGGLIADLLKAYGGGGGGGGSSLLASRSTTLPSTTWMPGG